MMPRKPARMWTRFGAAGAYWVMAAWLAQSAVGADIGRAGQKLEERIELQLKGRDAAPLVPPTPRERTHEDSIEPWELVCV